MGIADEMFPVFHEQFIAHDKFDVMKFGRIENTLYRILEKLQQISPEWILCSERLPEIDEDVLIYYPLWKDSPIQVAHLQHDGILFESSDGEFNFKASAVTHWMPIPDPPVNEGDSP